MNQMKRKNSFNISTDRLKRAGSSLFSIATILDEDDIEHLAPKGEIVEKSSPAISKDSSTRPRAVSTYQEDSSVANEENGEDDDNDASISSCSDEGINTITKGESTITKSPSIGGFFIEDDDDDMLICRPVVEQAPKKCTNSSNVQDAIPSMTNDQSVKKEAVQTTMKTLKPGDLKTGLLFEGGELHYDVHNRFHKERPLRISAIRDHLAKKEIGIMDRCILYGKEVNNDDEEGTKEELALTDAANGFLDDEDFLRVHVPGYMSRLDNLSTCKCQIKLDREAKQFKSIYFTPNTVSAAKTAAAGLCQLTARVVSGELDNGFAVIRPPGHHAEPGLAGGYCVINNVAVAAAFARERLGLKKILIVDWDVHHGNGTQSIFLNDPSVLYFSVHRYHNGNYFPFLRNAGPTTVGTSSGSGYNVNIGWNRKGFGDDEYYAVWEKVLMKIAREFEPELVLVSAGFDAAKGDMGECNVTPKCFANLTKSLKSLAGGRVVCALEGGYLRSVLAVCVESVITSLLENEVENEESIEDEEEEEEECISRNDILACINVNARQSIELTIECHKPYWSCFRDEEKNKVDTYVEEKKEN